ncbi:hypothetical protein Vadar_030119 [Vaccinium darrowii]|uniref:Uncharacterized protein n=1 Tax=Vaccinium darrowii TaxID=229202 RepID=A0ACB7XVQ4_9ERIC|nr:hypothetical protein Vadar_030119 [Vaccinium darrowii]
MYQKFSQPTECQHDLMIYGLGYDSTGDDFKVVGLALYLTPVTVHVFSSKLSSWKIVGEFGYDQIDGDMRVPILNGKPHWFVNSDCRIVCWDATEEKFREVPRPNYGREFFFYDFDLLSFTADGEVVMVLNSKLLQLVIYNQKQKRFKRIGIPEDWEDFDVALHYVESLVSPYGCNRATTVEGTANQMEMEEKEVKDSQNSLTKAIKEMLAMIRRHLLDLCEKMSTHQPRSPTMDAEDNSAFVAEGGNTPPDDVIQLEDLEAPPAKLYDLTEDVQDPLEEELNEFLRMRKPLSFKPILLPGDIGSLLEENQKGRFATPF